MSKTGEYTILTKGLAPVQHKLRQTIASQRVNEPSVLNERELIRCSEGERQPCTAEDPGYCSVGAYQRPFLHQEESTAIQCLC